MTATTHAAHHTTAKRCMMKPKVNKKTLGIVGIALATILAVKNRKKIKEKAGDATEKGAMALHKRIGYPIYNYLRKKNNIPY